MELQAWLQHSGAHGIWSRKITNLRQENHRPLLTRGYKKVCFKWVTGLSVISKYCTKASRRKGLSSGRSSKSWHLTVHPVWSLLCSPAALSYLLYVCPESAWFRLREGTKTYPKERRGEEGGERMRKRILSQ